MMLPRRAQYGALENSHALLACDGDRAELPPELLGLTDKPPATYAPGEKWWPAVGCGPVGQWWALWWTVPDVSAKRSGMVCSAVALWPLDKIGEVEDLEPVLCGLAGVESLSAIPSSLLEGLAEALLSSDSGRPVVPGLDFIPGLIAALWRRLWPETRCHFSARVAMSPPQGGESVAPPWFYGIPDARLPQWADRRVVTTAHPTQELSRAAAWLMGRADASMAEILDSLPMRPKELSGLQRLSRTADRLDRLRLTPTYDHASEFLRSLVPLAPHAQSAATLKSEALRILVQRLAAATPGQLRALANLKEAELAVNGPLAESLSRWVRQNAPMLPLLEASHFLEILTTQRAESWWVMAVRAAFSEGLANPDSRWATSALHWLSLSPFPASLATLLPTTQEIEQRLVTAAFSEKLPMNAAQQIRQQSIERGWSRLHAWTLFHHVTPSEALQAQRAFQGNPLPGLALLVEKLPGTDVVAGAILHSDPSLLELVALRTAKAPELLQAIDVRAPAWRALWSAHVRAGGTLWPPGVQRRTLGEGLLNALVAGDPSQDLLVLLAPELGIIAFEHPRRGELWTTHSPKLREALLPPVVDEAIKRYNAGEHIPALEHPLRDAIVARARQSAPSARLVAMLLEWNVTLSEQEVIGWLERPRANEWAPIAEMIGRSILQRGWKRAAELLYDRRNSRPELLPAAFAAQDLLSKWQRLMLSFSSGSDKSSHVDPELLIQRVASVGARLAPHELDYLWERAEGELKHLPEKATPEVRWQTAARLAHQGSLSEGLFGLVKALISRLPYNQDLQELESLLKKHGSRLKSQ